MHNVALVRIKVFGRPLLKLAASDQSSGSPLLIGGVKDGAYGLIPVKVAEPASKDGSKWAQLAGDVPPGNSGAPAVDEQGSVVGIITLRKVEERAVGFMIPAAFILALDSTLPTQPWASLAAAQPPAGQPTPAPTPAATPANLDDIDALIGTSFLTLSDNLDVIVWADAGIKGFGFRNGVPKPVYDLQQDLDGYGLKLAEVRTDDPLRQKVIKNLLQVLAMQKGSTENFIRAVVIGQQTGVWGAQSQDAFNRASSIRKGLDEKIVEMRPDIAELEKASAKFRESMFPEARYWLGLLKRPSGYSLGVEVYARRPFFLLVVFNDGFGHKIGLRAGDTIRSLNGRDFTETYDLEAVKMVIKENLGKKIAAVLERDGKLQNVTLRVPKQIPASALTN